MLCWWVGTHGMDCHYQGLLIVIGLTRFIFWWEVNSKHTVHVTPMIYLLFSHSVVSNSLWPHGRQHTRPPCPSPTPGVYSTEFVMPSNHLILCHPLFLLPSIFPASGSFPISQFLASGGQSIEASASTSVLPKNIQDWFPLGLTSLLYLQSKGLSRVFSNTTVQKHQFFSTQPSLWSNSHIHPWLLEKP